MKKQIEQVIENVVRPALKKDGGDLEILKIEDGNVLVRVLGRCSSCPNAQTEVTVLIEESIRKLLNIEVRADIDIAVNEELNAFSRCVRISYKTALTTSTLMSGYFSLNIFTISSYSVALAEV